ncbi:MAG: AAA family ATPase [Clostridia bacterium]|nr:AAA family ATPase [Clostridia bacterium]
MLILISGCSGAGKNTIIQELLKRNQNIKFLKSCTTRKKRPYESKDSYIYLSKDEFDQKLKNDEIFEHEEIHQNFYGLLKSSLNDVVRFDKDDKHFVKDVGVLGQINLVRALKNKVNVLSIFLTVPRKELIRRLTLRGERDIDLRLSRMEFEMGYINNFDVIVKNIDIEKTTKRVEKLINKFKTKTIGGIKC